MLRAAVLVAVLAFAAASRARVDRSESTMPPPMPPPSYDDIVDDASQRSEGGIALSRLGDAASGASGGAAARPAARQASGGGGSASADGSRPPVEVFTAVPFDPAQLKQHLAKQEPGARKARVAKARKMVAQFFGTALLESPAPDQTWEAGEAACRLDGEPGHAALGVGAPPARSGALLQQAAGEDAAISPIQVNAVVMMMSRMLGPCVNLGQEIAVPPAMCAIVEKRLAKQGAVNIFEKRGQARLQKAMTHAGVVGLASCPLVQAMHRSLRELCEEIFHDEECHGLE